MSQIEILLPKMGESVAEATITKWLKKPGDAVAADEPIVEIATDKVDSEVPAPEAGVMGEQLVKEGDVVKVGQPIARIGSNGATSAPAAKAPEAPKAAPAPASNGHAPVEAKAPVTAGAPVERTGPSGKFYSPLVRTIAKSEGVSMQELEALSGSGQGGRVTKKDILDYLPNRGASPSIAPEKAALPSTAATSAPAPAPSVAPALGDELIEMDRMRKLIADHMVMSKHVSPHVTSFVEVDMTSAVLWRDKVKDQFLKKYNQKITFTPLFIQAVAKAIQDFPMINVSVDGQRIIKKLNINIGMAAALPSGNLIVPVIKNADRLNLVGLTYQVNDLADRARANKLKPEEIQDGTFTITNVGGFGNVMGTPIINQPQVAILATGIIKKKPAVIETPTGDLIGIRHMMFISLSYDHRVVDGSLGGKFLRKVGDYLEQFDVNQTI